VSSSSAYRRTWSWRPPFVSGRYLLTDGNHLLTDGNQALAVFAAAATPRGRRPVNIEVDDLVSIDAGLLLFVAFVVGWLTQRASDNDGL